MYSVGYMVLNGKMTDWLIEKDVEKSHCGPFYTSMLFKGLNKAMKSLRITGSWAGVGNCDPLNKK